MAGCAHFSRKNVSGWPGGVFLEKMLGWMAWGGFLGRLHTKGLIESRWSDPLCVQSDPLASKSKFEDLASQRFVDPSGLDGLGAYFSRKKG